MILTMMALALAMVIITGAGGRVASGIAHGIAMTTTGCRGGA